MWLEQSLLLFLCKCCLFLLQLSISGRQLLPGSNERLTHLRLVQVSYDDRVRVRLNKSCVIIHQSIWRELSLHDGDAAARALVHMLVYFGTQRAADEPILRRLLTARVSIGQLRAL